MIYKDEKLVKRYFNDDHPLSVESRQLKDMDSYYIPDDSKPFYENLVLKHTFDLRKKYLREIYDIKLKFFSETGEKL